MQNSGLVSRRPSVGYSVVRQRYTGTFEYPEARARTEGIRCHAATILDLRGKMTLGEGDELLKDKINSLIQQDRKQLVLNLADVPYIDSAVLGEIVRTYTTVSRQVARLEELGTEPTSAG